MAWKRNRRLIDEGFRDLEFVPRERSGWDATLSALAYGARMDVGRGEADLAAWAARHCLPASSRCRELGSDALVLWHGTSRERAEKISEHGLFHKKGLWTARHPSMPHSFCRHRSEEYGVEGAVVCLAVDLGTMSEGADFEVEGKSDVVRFFHGLGPEVVEYVLVHEEIRFAGESRSREPAPWPAAKFKRVGGRWVPARKAPVRYSDSESYSTPDELARIVLARLLDELGEATPLEIFSALYSAVDPIDVLTHRDILDLVGEMCFPGRKVRKSQTYRARNAPAE